MYFVSDIIIRPLHENSKESLIIILIFYKYNAATSIICHTTRCYDLQLDSPVTEKPFYQVFPCNASFTRGVTWRHEKFLFQAHAKKTSITVCIKICKLIDWPSDDKRESDNSTYSKWHSLVDGNKN